MIGSPKPKFIFGSLIPNLKWVSAAPSQLPPHPIDHLRAFFNGNKDTQHSDYELTLVSALKSCSSLLALSQGQQIHSLVFKSGLLSNIFVKNSLISFYVKCGLISNARSLFDTCSVLDPVSCNIMLSGYVKSGSLDNARHLFEKMPIKGCVSYTTMVMGLAQNNCWLEAIGVFKDMRFAGVIPNEVTLASVISAYSHVGGILNCRMLHALAFKLGLEALNIVATNLVHMYCVCSRLVDLARDLFERIPAKDVVSWGTIIDGYVQIERLGEALKMYRSMLRTGLGPNEVMIVDLISACGRSMAVSEGQQFHGIIVRTGFDCYDFIQATIIHFYAACGEINLAFLQFELGSKDHVSSWNALISGFVRNGMIEQARQLFDEMPERDVFSWSSMISGRWAHEYILSNSIPLNDNLNAALIDMYAKCGSITTALQLFYEIQDRVSSVSPWNAIICGLAMHGHANLSLKLFSQLQRVRIKPNSITFIGVLSACCHAGLVEAGEKYFKGMKNLYNIEPNIKHYGCMIDLLGRAGRLKEADEMIRKMPMKADVVIWGTLLAACRTHGNLEIGERAAKNLAKLDTSHGAGRVLLSNIYADAGRWDDAFLVRRAMQSQRMKKSPGCSGVV
ncbi:hypothetical protein PVL29_005838 [Vitis rotundifolia]|uniref:Uncharacterized protein n=1 Tax=Vitis rotundifolia TaxID=103349 RepID=A0AA39E026_VITRO|nr:hypothetical protein PVL29_005838 [Vitis rotundifolia]